MFHPTTGHVFNMHLRDTYKQNAQRVEGVGTWSRHNTSLFPQGAAVCLSSPDMMSVIIYNNSTVYTGFVQYVAEEEHF